MNSHELTSMALMDVVSQRNRLQAQLDAANARIKELEAGSVVWHPIEQSPDLPAEMHKRDLLFSSSTEVWMIEAASEEQMAELGWFESMYRDVDDAWIEQHGVTAWAELPAPYKEVSDD